MPAKITVREVAKRANVSTGTVSRVLNDDPAVSVDVSRRVQDAVKALNYTPLRKTRVDPDCPLEGRNVALITLGMDSSMAALPVVAQAMHGAQEALTRLGAKVLLGDTPDLSTTPSFVSGARLDGAILKGALQGVGIASSKSRIIKHLRDLPTVWLLGRPDGCWGDAVQAQDLALGEIAADYLVDHGHRYVAFLNPKPNHATFHKRQLGFTDRIRARGARCTVLTGDQNNKGALPLNSMLDADVVQSLVNKLLKEKIRPTAIFTPADGCAALVYRALAIHDLKVGDEISLISANNETAFTNVLYPGLTTLDVGAEQMGHVAADQLAWRLAHPKMPDVTIGLMPTLVERESVRDLSH